jgi:hypothetical protein
MADIVSNTSAFSNYLFFHKRSIFIYHPIGRVMGPASQPIFLFYFLSYLLKSRCQYRDYIGSDDRLIIKFEAIGGIGISKGNRSIPEVNGLGNSLS